MKIFFTISSLLLTVMLTACTSTPEGSNPTSIPTPPGKSSNYSGVKQTSDQLLAALEQVDASWSELSDSDTNHFTSFSKPNCNIRVFDSFQDAVDNDGGSYFDNWTYIGSYAQFGLVLIGSIDECRTSLPEEVWFPNFVDDLSSSSEALLASESQILDCLTRRADCLRVEDQSLPGPNLLSSIESLEHLLILDENGFCVDSIGDMVGSQKSGCELTEDKAGSSPEIMNSSGLWLSETRGVRDILSSAASNSPDLGKYMIYGDGWIVVVHGSTEAQKNLFIEMNRLIKGNLVARY